MYSIFLNGIKIGTTELEFCDSSMGVVFGKIISINDNLNYNFIKNYCEENNVEIIHNDFDDKLIGTQNIQELKVYNNSGIEITKNSGCNIEGMDNDGYQITILGIPNSLLEKEFPHHINK